MKPRDDSEVADMALAAEMARQLCHDFSNFLYNLFLQMEIHEAEGNTAAVNAWQGIKEEGKKIVHCLHEWDQFLSQFSYDEALIDLHDAIRRAVDANASHDGIVILAPAIHAGPLTVAGSKMTVVHLLRLVFEDLQRQWNECAASKPIVSVQTEKDNNTATVIFRCESPAEPGGAVASANGAGQASLMSATCRSLAVRLGASIHRDPTVGGRICVRVAFPRALMSSQ